MPIKRIGLLLISVIFLSGCWDKLEVEKRAYVVGIGLDKGEDGMIKVTFMIPNPEFASQAQGGASNVPPKEIITMEANDLISIKNKANIIVAKTITYDQLQFIAVSEELAADREFIRFIYDATKDVEIRRDVNLFITKEETAEYFRKTNPKLELRVHKYFDLIIDHVQRTGFIPSNSELLQFFRVTEAGSDLFLGIYSTSEKKENFDWQDKNKIIAGELTYEGATGKTQFAGGAVFKNGKMIGKVTGDEVRVANLVNNTVTTADDVLASYPDPFDKNQQLAVKINKLHKNKIKMNLKAEKPLIDVTVPIVVEILSDHSMTNYSLKKNRVILEKKVKESIEKEFMDFAKKTQTEFKAQPFGWSLAARKKFKTLKEYQDYNFQEKYPDMEVRIHIDMKITDFGRQKNIPHIKGVSK